ncbi:hypothetical protein ACGFH8_26050 [Micromonospora sp. NPDC049175]|uniref:hypothetical protein n=1 Tax=Micromonospora sp. NPDC049175 TaxID=3364266 RepID=UPI0037141D68
MTEWKPGDLLLIGGACSVQFSGERALRLRLVSVDPRPTYHGWVWLTGYVLNGKGLAVDRREVFVQQAGVRLLPAAPPPATPAPRSNRSARPGADRLGIAGADRLGIKETGRSQ